MGAAAVKKQDTGPAKRRVPGVFFPLHGKKMGILPPPVQEKNELRKEKNYAIQNDSPDAGGGAEEAGLP